jgi:hypothetical protein
MSHYKWRETEPKMSLTPISQSQTHYQLQVMGCFHESHGTVEEVVKSYGTGIREKSSLCIAQLGIMMVKLGDARSVDNGRRLLEIRM